MKKNSKNKLAAKPNSQKIKRYTQSPQCASGELSSNITTEDTNSTIVPFGKTLDTQVIQ